MFKKVVVVMVIAMLLAGVGFAQEAREILTYEVGNSSTVSYTIFNVPVTSIYPNNVDMILGFTVLPYGDGNAELNCAIYDTTSSTLADWENLELMAELEALNDNTHSLWYNYPRSIIEGVTVRLGPNSRVIIYFSRG